MLNSAFTHISASASRAALAEAHNCSTSSADATAMAPTDSPRQRHAIVDHKLKNGRAQTQDTTGLLNQLLFFDDQITSFIGLYSYPKTRFQHIIKNTCKVLEISGHGLPWFSISGLLILFYLFTGNTLSYEYGINLFIVLVSDILVIAPIKVFFKRPRPVMNIGTIPLSMSSVDNYAFPSGHATRCMALAAYFCYMPPFNPWTHLWYIWGLLVSLSRVAICRHHVLDVGVGMVTGLFIFDLVRRCGVLLGV